ncbi:hypothetical protein [Streptomyces sp. NPDC058989]|uniref:hypothetical protein n=1 Tax=Streptomyces sp. NPDC058989 TaxID=3346686 RepID=UPI0036B8478E
MSGTRFDRYDSVGAWGTRRLREPVGAHGAFGSYAVREVQGRQEGEPAGGRPCGGAALGRSVETGRDAETGRDGETGRHTEVSRGAETDQGAETDRGAEADQGDASACDDASAYDDDAAYDDAAHDRDALADVTFGSGSGSGGDDDDRHGRSHPTGGGFGGEDELRRLLQSRVGDLEPAADALEQLRRAVPARRQRRRHLVVGAAAALLLGGTSIPAMVHVVDLADGSTDRSANTASSQRAQGGAEGAHGEGTEHAGPRPTDEAGAKPGGRAPEGKGKAAEKNGAGHGAGAGTPAPDATMDVTSPVCSRDQLGQGTGTVLPADSAGRVYGSFRVVNTSATACSVEGGGAVGVVAQGSTNPDRIHVVDHTSGDEATGLPDPAITPDQLVLKPGEAYEVKFAWIPESGGGPTGCVTPGPSPTPDASQQPDQSPDSGAAPAGDGSGQAGGDDGTGGGGTAAGGVVLSHTPEAGEPAATEATIADACAGTVYRTEALATQ